ncbi:MAG: aminotransferase class V-fold PLP-dependent enzyme, partial [Eubacteriales bacterium]
MIYLDNGATTFLKPPQVQQAMVHAMANYASPGRGGYGAAMAADWAVFQVREQVAHFFDADVEQVVFTTSATHGLNMA